MSCLAPAVLSTSRDLAAEAGAVWRALTTPALMRRWMLIPADVVPNGPLDLGSRIEWRRNGAAPYLVGTVTACHLPRHLRVDLQDISWSRPAAPGEVVWDFVLTPREGGVRLDYRLGDLAIDADAEGWLAAYKAADEPARIATLLEEVRP